MNKRWLVGCMLAAMALQAANAEGPGMIVTYVGTEKGISIDIKKISLPSGKLLGSPGSFGYAANPLNGGKTEGIAPDGRQLPEWVEFVWSEPAYPKVGTFEERMALPHKTARVMVRDRIPQAVVDEVMEAKRKRQYGKLPDKKWDSFLAKSGLEAPPLPEAAQQIDAFLSPPALAAAKRQSFHAQWVPPGPWHTTTNSQENGSQAA